MSLLMQYKALAVVWAVFIFHFFINARLDKGEELFQSDKPNTDFYILPEKVLHVSAYTVLYSFSCSL